MAAIPAAAVKIERDAAATAPEGAAAGAAAVPGARATPEPAVRACIT